jgi:toxin ParE1/3/4
MARGTIILLPLAKRDMLEIWRYIAGTNSEFVADLVITRLNASIDILSSAPLIGRVRKEYPGSPRGFPVRSHIVFYQPLPDRAGIEVWRVLHGARDLRGLVRRSGDDT